MRRIVCMLAVFAAVLILTGGRLFVGFIPLYFLLEYGLN